MKILEKITSVTFLISSISFFDLFSINASFLVAEIVGETPSGILSTSLIDVLMLTFVVL